MRLVALIAAAGLIGSTRPWIPANPYGIVAMIRTIRRNSLIALGTSQASVTYLLACISFVLGHMLACARLWM